MRFVTLDISTKFVAYAIWDDATLIEHGKIFVSGNGDAAIGSIAAGILECFNGSGISVVVYESAFLGNNVNVVKQLSKVVGSAIAAFYLIGVREFVAVPPITWQTGIGVGKTSAKEKDRLSRKYPGKSVSWLRNKDRENRKQKIIDHVNSKFDKQFSMSENDIADAIGIGDHMIAVWGLDKEESV